ncbi:hypothetical protein [Chitiniphilus eburneus]|uniref:Uncharacterized protein n=1 Tax=Chitiniphilus eburneus TaxID=2571148 RepID=A0A4U0PHQ1_9NEIS|nr:hypothetical protein [Chitiniphilus eburneus]TJZ66662.1 hypothetical protein FAZ21_17175 [Chitiniphilus eburneus]
MRTLTQEYLGGTLLDEDHYKIDLAVLERYQSFSSELLRLALLGLAAYGFLIANVALKMDYTTVLTQALKPVSPFFWSAVALALCTGFALGHRYFSTDCLTHFVRQRRLGEWLAQARPPRSVCQAALQTIDHEERSLARDLFLCKWSLIAACASLFVGVGCFAVGIGLLSSSMQSASDAHSSPEARVAAPQPVFQRAASTSSMR